MSVNSNVLSELSGFVIAKSFKTEIFDIFFLLSLQEDQQFVKNVKRLSFHNIQARDFTPVNLFFKTNKSE